MNMNIAVLNIIVRQNEELIIPEHSGSMLRGAFGMALRELSCITKLEDCKQCPVKQLCPYVQIFENTAIKDEERAGNPYTLRLPKAQKVKVGGLWQFHMMLIGHVIEHYALVIRAWQKVFQRGVGGLKHRSIGEVIKVSNGKNILLDKDKNIALQKIEPQHIERVKAVPELPPVKQLTMNFLAPFRLQHEGKIIFDVNTLDVNALIKSLYYRIQRLQHDESTASDKFHLDIADKFELDEILLQVQMTQKLESVKVKRYSNRQKTKLELFGLIGQVNIHAEPDVLKKLIPLLWYGQLLGVGKSTTLGMGQYQLNMVR